MIILIGLVNCRFWKQVWVYLSVFVELIEFCFEVQVTYKAEKLTGYFKLRSEGLKLGKQ